ncbi:translation initiation factor IF-2 associated domain-containing protein [Pseudomonadota bacterium]
MTQINIKSFAEQIGISADKLLVQLEAAGVGGKKTSDTITDDERIELLNHLRGGGDKGSVSRKNKITLRQRTTSQVKRTSRTGSTHTVQVEVRKRRTFVKRSILEEAAPTEESSAEVVETVNEAAETIATEPQPIDINLKESAPQQVEEEPTLSAVDAEATADQIAEASQTEGKLEEPEEVVIEQSAEQEPVAEIEQTIEPAAELASESVVKSCLLNAGEGRRRAGR